MRSWESDFWGSAWHRKPRKKPPPKHGIAVRKIGTTWWGKRWIDALEGISSGWSNRLARGRTYARGGRVHDLELLKGGVTARVTGSRVYRVEIKIAPLSAAAWSKAVKAMAARAAFAAKLLDGAMPEEIDEVFRAGGSSLFPAKERDLETECSCPDWANPCKHVAAVHYVLGEAFDRDPFLLFELRGRGKEAVLAELRRARAGMGEEAEVSAAPRRKRASAAGARRTGRGATPVEEREVARSADPSRRKSGRKETIAARADAGMDDVDAVALDASAAEGYERARSALGALRFRIEAPPSHALVLRQLGPPPGWSAEKSIVEALGPVYEAVGAMAREIALRAEGRERECQGMPTGGLAGTDELGPRGKRRGRRWRSHLAD